MLGSCGLSGLTGSLFGSVACSVGSRTERPVVLVRAGERVEDEHVPTAPGPPPWPRRTATSCSAWTCTGCRRLRGADQSPADRVAATVAGQVPGCRGDREGHDRRPHRAVDPRSCAPRGSAGGGRPARPTSGPLGFSRATRATTWPRRR
ncbi:hypothetical protein [Streptomyces chartreusis]|uniref:hypothetical protein n=1 Tax=Streptomyces chartreusis TaxID=1969 RepID=UPI00365D084C